MYVCMCVCICGLIQTGMYVCMYVYICMYMGTNPHAIARAPLSLDDLIQTGMYVCKYVCSRHTPDQEGLAYVCMYVCVCMYMGTNPHGIARAP